MTARSARAFDRAAIVYLDAQLKEQERKLPWLAEKIGMPYGSLYNYFHRGHAVGFGDFVNMLDALHVDVAVAMTEISKIAPQLRSSVMDAQPVELGFGDVDVRHDRTT